MSVDRQQAPPVPPSGDQVRAVRRAWPVTQRGRAAGRGPRHRRERRPLYIPVAGKFTLAVAFMCLWVGLSTWIAQGWITDLSRLGGPVVGWAVVILVALLPGAVVSFMAASLALDRQPALRVAQPTTPVTVIVAARNEEAGIGETIASLWRAEYAGPVTVMLADNGSTDRTAEVARATADELGIDLVIIREETPGKSNALNTALLSVTTPYVVTVDADTLLHREALSRLVSRLESAPGDTVAVAGTVLVRNSRTNLLARMQEWDYYLGIAAVKRMQGLYQATLVAQGAFSVYLTEEVRRIGGWPDAIGEDIVVTWKLMEGGNRVYFEPTAVAFTDVPVKVTHFMRQRARWARGMFEGLRAVPPWRQQRPLTRFVAGIDLFIPFLDIGYALIWLPGILLFALGFPLVVSAWTLVVFPMTLLVYGLVRTYQSKHVFGPLGLRVRRNRFGYAAFLLLYQALCSTASLAGYAQFLAGTRRRWK
ncbi:glycosyltransferase family 2 protein [Cellulomonas bogoriensis]|uniref:Glycosyl transferase n=1 Tax=Cellulomonas bogoriensis 69B4 = DSM 16987 TaxID=1386082 RepID=A0A0A0BRL6_9CELL|nr:glycosyltransferase [Cellulomonas bogoriensis]KGM10262.1 glycosyl transferase [Cellulomonas bogoriensis 69B4 = DSM 16987]